MPKLFIAFWNLENLFAPEGFPGREPWIAENVAADLAGWTQALLDRKINQLTFVIAGMNTGTGPDVLGVCEVENKFCLEQLAASLNAALPMRNYGIVHADATKDKRGIDTAFLHDQNTVTANLNEFFSHFVLRRTGTRDISQVTFKALANNAEFVALCNHWPSRSGGHWTESQGFRMTAGETLGYWHQRIKEEKGDIPVIALGDFNDDPGDQSLVFHALSHRERDDVMFGTNAMFYNLAWNYRKQDAIALNGKKRTLYGTLYWEGNANQFDQILISKHFMREDSQLRAMEETARIVAPQAMVSNSKNDGPIRFGLPKGDATKNINQNGFADHFPVCVEIDVIVAVA
jgi:Endonuclease/Exonuclease/phosphatase family